ncbi:MAG: formate dehydrogenase accessory sulfurtransferase FdhD [Flammeovirgaceae bacterium]|nr:formate dehydrogenase accessory sulfurtransferase FdhD [Flammeovirgaceae bacterium]
MKAPVQSISVSRVLTNTKETSPDLVAVEEPLEIRIGYGEEKNREQITIAVTMRTPGNDFELAVGFLFTEGILNSLLDLESLKYCSDTGKQEEKENVVRAELKPHLNMDVSRFQRNFYMSSSCGVCGKASIESVSTHCSKISDQSIVSPLIIHKLQEELRRDQIVFDHTGGLHASALFDFDGNKKIIREDVGRHNALDKVIGAMLLKKENAMNKSILWVSGRASFELVQKAAMAGIPLMVAVGAPSSLAISLAQEVNMTLLGFARNEKFNIYSGEQRIQI